jgi:hypothetical protein
MTNVMGKIMAEVLCMLAIATKEMKQKRTSAFISGTELPLTYIRTETFFKKLIGRNDIEDALQKLDKLEQGELRTVTAQVLKTTTRGVAVISRMGAARSSHRSSILTLFELDAKETKVIVQQIASEINSRDCSYHDPIVNTCTSSQIIAGERILHDLQGWLTPPDPSTNHNIACSSQHERTAVWVFTEDIYKEWESSGSLFWIHGKGLSPQMGLHVF